MNLDIKYKPMMAMTILWKPKNSKQKHLTVGMLIEENINEIILFQTSNVENPKPEKIKHIKKEYIIKKKYWHGTIL